MIKWKKECNEWIKKGELKEKGRKDAWKDEWMNEIKYELKVERMNKWINLKVYNCLLYGMCMEDERMNEWIIKRMN